MSRTKSPYSISKSKQENLAIQQLKEEDDYLQFSGFCHSLTPKHKKKSIFLNPWTQEKTPNSYYQKHISTGFSIKKKFENIASKSPFLYRNHQRKNLRSIIAEKGPTDNKRIVEFYRLPNMVKFKKKREKKLGISNLFNSAKKINVNEILNENLDSASNRVSVGGSSKYLKNSDRVSDLRRFIHLNSAALRSSTSDRCLKSQKSGKISLRKNTKKSKKLKFFSKSERNGKSKVKPIVLLENLIEKNKRNFGSSDEAQKKSRIKAKVYEKIGDEMQKIADGLQKSNENLKISLEKNKRKLSRDTVYDISNIISKSKFRQKVQEQIFEKKTFIPKRQETDTTQRHTMSTGSKRVNLKDSDMKKCKSYILNSYKKANSSVRLKIGHETRSGIIINEIVESFDFMKKRNSEQKMKKIEKKIGALNSSCEVNRRLAGEKKKIKWRRNHSARVKKRKGGYLRF